MGNTAGAGVSGLTKDDWILLEVEEWNELFESSREFTNSEGFSNGESEEMEASVKIKTLDGQRRSEKWLWDILT